MSTVGCQKQGGAIAITMTAGSTWTSIGGNRPGERHNQVTIKTKRTVPAGIGRATTMQREGRTLLTIRLRIGIRRRGVQVATGRSYPRTPKRSLGTLGGAMMVHRHAHPKRHLMDRRSPLAVSTLQGGRAQTTKWRPWRSVLISWRPRFKIWCNRYGRKKAELRRQQMAMKFIIKKMVRYAVAEENMNDDNNKTKKKEEPVKEPENEEDVDMQVDPVLLKEGPGANTDVAPPRVVDYRKKTQLVSNAVRSGMCPFAGTRRSSQGSSASAPARSASPMGVVLKEGPGAKRSTSQTTDPWMIHDPWVQGVSRKW